MQDGFSQVLLLLLVQRDGAQAHVLLVHAEGQLVRGRFLFSRARARRRVSPRRRPPRSRRRVYVGPRAHHPVGREHLPEAEQLVDRAVGRVAHGQVVVLVRLARVVEGADLVHEQRHGVALLVGARAAEERQRAPLARRRLIGRPAGRRGPRARRREQQQQRQQQLRNRRRRRRRHPAARRARTRAGRERKEHAGGHLRRGGSEDPDGACAPVCVHAQRASRSHRRAAGGARGPERRRAAAGARFGGGARRGGEARARSLPREGSDRGRMRTR